MNLTQELARALMDRINWTNLHAEGGDASAIAGAVMTLATAETTDTANAAYWALDNDIVVQGEVHDSACAVVEPLLMLLSGPLAAAARAKILDLLYEIYDGQPRTDGQVDADRSVVEECNRRIREGRWLFYDALQEQSADVRRTAIDLLAKIEEDSELRMILLDKARRIDPSDHVRQAAEWWLNRREQ